MTSLESLKEKFLKENFLIEKKAGLEPGCRTNIGASIIIKRISNWV